MLFHSTVLEGGVIHEKCDKNYLEGDKASHILVMFMKGKRLFVTCCPMLLKWIRHAFLTLLFIDSFLAVYAFYSNTWGLHTQLLCLHEMLKKMLNHEQERCYIGREVLHRACLLVRLQFRFLSCCYFIYFTSFFEVWNICNFFSYIS
jgi:hypothetical protein